MARVYIVGAGPGDMELLTLKAKRCVEEADVIVYDRLVNSRILSLAKDDCELIYLGKGNTEGGVIQDEINRTLVEKALEGKVVTRLKGGDPFVFGRGGEEILELVKNNIKFEEVPGITSSISVPAYAGIPVTHRGVSKSFHVFTGHTEKNGKWHNFDAIAKLEGTLIFLMGVKNLGRIAGDLLENGKRAETPVALIEKGSTSKQRIVTGTLENICEVAAQNKVVPPAIIIIGDVVNQRADFKWFEDLELQGRKIMVTRDRRQAGAMSEMIDRRGGEAVELPLIEIEDRMKDYNYEEIEGFTSLLFNSANGVRSFFNNIDDIRRLGKVKIGAVGVKTLEALKEYKIGADFVPEKYLVDELVAGSVEFTKEGDMILLVTSDISPVDIEKWNAKYGRSYSKVTAYCTRKVVHPREEVLSKLKGVDYVTFLSSSTVDAYMESLGGDFTGTEGVKYASIGPVTSEAMRKYGLSVDIEAKNYTAEGVIEAIKGEGYAI